MVPISCWLQEFLDTSHSIRTQIIITWLFFLFIYKAYSLHYLKLFKSISNDLSKMYFNIFFKILFYIPANLFYSYYIFLIYQFIRREVFQCFSMKWYYIAPKYTICFGTGMLVCLVCLMVRRS